MKSFVTVFAAVFILSLTSEAQTLSGFVYDINGTPLPSAAVVLSLTVPSFPIDPSGYNFAITQSTDLSDFGGGKLPNWVVLWSFKFHKT